MRHFWLSAVSVVVVAFACLAMVSQFADSDRPDYGAASVSEWGLQQQTLAGMTNIVEVESASAGSCGGGRALDLVLPANARVYMLDMLGPTNGAKGGLYFYLAYYLFPREVAVSLDQPARWYPEGFRGTPASSDLDLVSHGFYFVADTTGGTIHALSLGNVQLKPVANPEWYPSRRDQLLAFLLPLFSALSGFWLLRLLFPGLYGQMPLLEKLACSLGLSVMAVAAITLGAKLCGFHVHGLVFSVTGAGACLALWFNRSALGKGFRHGVRHLFLSPVLLVGAYLFFLVFRMAGQIGLMEFDAVAGWALKAKIIHLCAGSDIIRWFSEPRLAHAHLDYPVLVPSLHAATYDSLGRVDEFVTKFWYAWMLLLLCAAVSCLAPSARSRARVPAFLLLAIVLLPLTRKYVQWEGATMPMIFFVVLGFLQCTLGHLHNEPARWRLGLTFLFGAAMAKFEGAIFLAAAVLWLVLMPSCRKSFGSVRSLVRPALFCLLSALPFFWLRLHIPVLAYESGWAGYVAHNPVLVLRYWPTLMLAVLSRSFFSANFANWDGAAGHLHWIGKWEGFRSLFHHPSLGLEWICVLMAFALWFVFPNRRKPLLWLFAVTGTSVAALGLVFSSFLACNTLSDVLGYTSDATAQRYLFPLLLAWAASLLVLLYSRIPSHTSPENSAASELPGPRSVARAGGGK